MSHDPTSPRRRVAERELDQLASAAYTVFSKDRRVVAVYLHGSAARGDPAADLDIGVVTAPRLEPAAIEGWAAELQRLGAPNGPEIDLRPLDGTAPRFRVTVLKEGRLLYERDRAARLRFEARAMVEWLDFKPTWERMRARMHERLTHG